MTSNKLTAAAAALTLLVSLPANTAFAQHNGGNGGHGGGSHAGGGHGGGGHSGGSHGGGHGGGGGFHGGGYHGGGYGHGGYHRGGYGGGGLATGLALGAILGTYQGQPYYCRGHRHWSNYYGRYVGGRC